MIKNLIFDFGNVVVHFDPDYMTGCITKNPDEFTLLRDTVFNPATFEKTDKGTITADEHKEIVCRSLPEVLHKKAKKILDSWYLNLPVWEGMEQLIKDAKEVGYKIYLLSNINIQFSENRDKVNILKLFDGIMLSSEIQHTKPDPVIYNTLLERYSLKAEECMFIDDRRINTEGGEAVGIRGYLFDGDAEKLRKYINSADDMAYKIKENENVF